VHTRAILDIAAASAVPQQYMRRSVASGLDIKESAICVVSIVL